MANDVGIGRLGIPTDQAPAITPVNFSLRDREIAVREGTGFLTRAAAGRLVAFEVDRIDSAGGVAWSVLARGLATIIDSPTEIELAAAQPLIPEPGDKLLVVRSDVLTGRRFKLGCAP